MQAGCGFKTPSPVFAVPLPVGAESARRLGVTSSPPPRDTGNDVITVGKRSGQWVTLSKALLLQLVERICQLSFQTDVTPSYRKSPDELDSGPETESLPQRPSSGGTAERAAERNSGSDVTDENTDPEVYAVPAYLVEDSTTSGPTLGCDHHSSSRADVVHTSPVEGHVVKESSASQDDDAKITPDDAAEYPPSGSSPDTRVCPISVDETTDYSGGLATATDEDRAPADACRGGEYQVNDRRHRHRRRTSACRRRLLRARRRTKLPLATSNGQVRKVSTRTGEHVARSTDSAAARSAAVHQLRGVRRCRQSWMALSKDIVYGAVENQLRQSAPATTSKSSAIWNPALSASPSEKRHQARPAVGVVDLTWYCGGEVAPPRLTGSDVRPCDAAPTGLGSSMLSELLGFGGTAGAATVAAMTLPPEVVRGAAVRQRHWSVAGGGADVAACDVASPPQRVRPDRDDDVTSAAVNYCIRRAATEPSGMNVSARIWRPVDSCRAVLPTSGRPRWVAVNKGEVCSLVDSLVSTMIATTTDHDGAKSGGRQPFPAEVASGDGLPTASDFSASSPSSDSPSSSTIVASKSSDKTVLEVSARCSLAASEPRKWKTDLLHRMRSEHT